MSDLFQPISTASFSFSGYSLTLIVAWLFSFGSFIYLYKRRRNSIRRPALITAILFLFLFHGPLILISDLVQKDLPNPWELAAAVIGTNLILLVWIFFSKKLDFPPSQTDKQQAQRSWAQVIIFSVSVVLTTIYLGSLSFECTGLYALIFDPELTLLAREMSIKLLGSGFGTLSYGLLTNAFIPASTCLILRELAQLISNRNIFRIFANLLVMIVFVGILMLPGIKGSLVPTVIAAGVYILLSTGTLRLKAILGISILTTLFSMMAAFELLKERGSFSQVEYNFAQCTQKVGACESGKQLLQSMGKRELSLGIDTVRIESLIVATDCTCDTKEDCSALQKTKNSYLKVKKQREQAQLEAAASGTTSSTTSTTLPTRSDRAQSYLESIFYRAFVVPAQIGVWHWHYVDLKSPNTTLALPFAKKIFGDSIDMTSLVHQQYYPEYSQGSAVATGTSPTSYLMAYPAYWGILGFLLSIGFTLFFDIAISFISNRLNKSLYDIATALTFVTCLNFMLSDFITTMISHGGGATLLTILLLGVHLSKNQKTL